MFDELNTLEDVRDYVRQGYRTTMVSPRLLQPGEERTERLPLAVAEVGPLMEHAVRLGGVDGLTRGQLKGVFELLGKDRFDRGLSWMLAAGVVTATTERRPNKAGRLQAQTVYRADGPETDQGRS